MSNKDLLREQFTIHKYCWIYETPRGIEVFFQAIDKYGCPVGPTRTGIIPWCKVREAVCRKDLRAK